MADRVETEPEVLRTELLRQFLDEDVRIKSLLQLNASPDTIRNAAHAVLDRVLDEVEPAWQENLDRAVTPI